MKRTLIVVLAMVAGLSMTASALVPLDYAADGEWTILLIDDPGWPEEFTGDPYEVNDGYHGSVVDFLTKLGVGEFKYDCNVTPECNTADGTYRSCPDAERTPVYDEVDLDGVILRKLAVEDSAHYGMFADFESLPDKAEMMLIAAGLDNNPALEATMTTGVAAFTTFANEMKTLVDWATADNRAALMAVFEVFCDAQPKVAKPAISAEGTYSASPKFLVTITCGTADATVRYTTDGNDATSSSTIYTAPFEVTGAAGTSVTIKARAFKTAMADSDKADAKEYTFATTPPVPPDPVACGTWEWEAKDADEKAFSGFKVIADPTFQAACVAGGAATVALGQTIAGATLVNGAIAQMSATLQGMSIPSSVANTIADGLVKHTMTPAQADALIGGGGTYTATFAGAQAQVDAIFIGAVVDTFKTVGELIGTVADDMLDAVTEDVTPVQVALPLYKEGFVSYAAAGTEMNTVFLGLIGGLLETLFKPIAATAAIPGAPSTGFTPGNLCLYLGDPDGTGLFALKGALVQGTLTSFGMTAAVTAMNTAAVALAAGGAAMNGVHVPALPILGGGKAGAEPFSPSGDYDGDGLSNYDAFQLVMGAGGDFEDYVAAASGGADGLWPGNPDVPAVGLLGLAALVSAITAGGAMVLRKK